MVTYHTNIARSNGFPASKRIKCGILINFKSFFYLKTNNLQLEFHFRIDWWINKEIETSGKFIQQCQL